MKTRSLLALSLLAALGCGRREVSASASIDGVAAPVRSVVSSAQPGRDGVIVRLADDRVIYADFPRVVPATLGIAQEADGSDGFRAGLAENGSPLIELCTSDASTEGSFDLRGTSRGANGYLDHIDGTLRVRFVGCDATYGGAPQSDLDFVIELPSMM
jgi:hypothetical protein